MFGQDCKLINGRFGVESVKKPFDYGIVPVTGPSGEVQTSINIHLLSYQTFYKVTDESVQGFCKTIYTEGSDLHLWAEDLTDKIVDGDVLHFPNVNKYVRVTSTDVLELDGWLNQSNRYLTEDGMYTSFLYNPLLYDIYSDFLYGYDFFNKLDEYGNLYPRPTMDEFFTPNSVNFLSCLLMEGSDLVSNFYSTTVQEAIDATQFFGYGRLYDFELMFTSFATGEYTKQFSFDYAGETYTMEVRFVTSSGVITNIFVNGSEIEFTASPSIRIKTPLSWWLDSNLDPIADSTDLFNRIRRIALFTYIISSDVPKEKYIEQIRATTLPAGYGVASLYSFEDLSSIPVPNTSVIGNGKYELIYVSENTEESDRTVYQSKEIEYYNEDSEYYQLTLQEFFSKIYFDGDLKDELPFTIDSFYSYTIDELSVYEDLYLNNPTGKDRVYFAPVVQVEFL
jgi:hypothetical protein